MFPLQLGALGSPPGILIGLVLLLLVLVVGRILMKLAWKLVVIAIVVIGTLWLLGTLGLGGGFLSAVPLPV